MIIISTYGYIRVSTREQNEDRQLIALREMAVPVVLDMPLLDTCRGKDLMGAFLSDIVLQVLPFVAENERTNIRQRQAEGIAAAKTRGVSGSADRPDRCRRTSIVPISGGKPGRSPAQRQQRSAGCLCLLSATGRRFNPSCCKGGVFTETLPSCKTVLPLNYFGESIDNRKFL